METSFVLILTIFGPSPGVYHIPDFVSQEACENAAKTWVLGTTLIDKTLPMVAFCAQQSVVLPQPKQGQHLI